MEKRVRVIKAAGNGSFIQEMAGDKVVNQIWILNRSEGAEIFKDLDSRYGFLAQIRNIFPIDLFKEMRI